VVDPRALKMSGNIQPDAFARRGNAGALSRRLPTARAIGIEICRQSGSGDRGLIC
jgi:hypothetical protein